MTPSDVTQAELRKVLLTSVHREVPLSHCETECKETGTTRSGVSTKAGSTILNKDNANTGRDLQAQKIASQLKSQWRCFMALVGIRGATVNFFLPQAMWK